MADFFVNYWGSTRQVVRGAIFIPHELPGFVAELFFGLARHWWGQRVATEACQALIDAVFQQLELDRIIARENREKVRSIRVMKRIGICCITNECSAEELLYERTGKRLEASR